ncbi:hypothetical protein [Schlesneria paludicola]|uniref:hypothetical protein n=1 Tax=Schlesneria paludicola TaxID=360056 RepID=UPI00029ADB29|nr:hypothetical protein [Schlesneria paludicola]
MSKTRVVQIVVGALLSAIFLVCAIVNFSRLQSRSDAPGMVDYLLYVGVPLITALAFAAADVVLAAVALLRDRTRLSSPDMTRLPSVNDVEVDLSRKQLSEQLKMNEQLKQVESVDARRTRIWKIIDELSDALRDDDAGSDALFIVRERFHKLQFAPTPHQATESTEDDEKPAPTKRAAS